jgi:hypothetical protein
MHKDTEMGTDMSMDMDTDVDIDTDLYTEIDIDMDTDINILSYPRHLIKNSDVGFKISIKS